jgi:hypothetical protein
VGEDGRDGGVAGEDELVDPGLERPLGGRRERDGAGDGPHLQGVGDDQAAEAHPVAEQAADHGRGQGGRGSGVDGPDDQVADHDRVQAGSDGGPEGDQVVGVEAGHAGRDDRQAVVGVDGGRAVAGEVLAHGRDPAGGQAAHEGHRGPAGGRRVGAEGAVADDPVPAGPGDVQDRGQVGRDPQGGQVPAGGQPVALDPLGGHAAELPGRRAGPHDPGQAGHPRPRLLVDGDLERDLGPLLQVGDQRPDLPGGDDVAPEQQQPTDPPVDQPPADRPRLGPREPDQQQLGELGAERREVVAPGPRRRCGACGQLEPPLLAVGYPPGSGAHGSRGGRVRARLGARLPKRLGRRRPARPARVARPTSVAGGQGQDQHQPGRQEVAPGQASTSRPSSDQRVWKVPGRSTRR